MISIHNVLDLLSLETAKKSGEDGLINDFTGNNIYIPSLRVYGGQLLAQSIIAAANTTSTYRHPASLHAYFVDGGDLDHETQFSVSRLRDGAAYSHREVKAFQSDSNSAALNSGRLISQSMVMFHEQENSAINFTAMPMPDVPRPEHVKSQIDKFSRIADKSTWYEYFASNNAFDIRQISPSLFMSGDPDGLRAKELVWVRFTEPELPELHNLTQTMQCALLAFISDQFAFSPALRKAGLSWLTPGASYVSLDHTQYFHRPIDLRKWHLFVGDSPAGCNARGLGIINVYSEDGDIVSTFTQEGSIRTKHTVSGTLKPSTSSSVKSTAKTKSGSIDASNDKNIRI